MTAEELEKTRRLTEEFIKGEGQNLQQELVWCLLHWLSKSLSLSLSLSPLHMAPSTQRQACAIITHTLVCKSALPAHFTMNKFTCALVLLLPLSLSYNAGVHGLTALFAIFKIRLDHESPTSWLEGWWDCGYLEYRVPTYINVNPFFIFKDDPTKPSQVHTISLRTFSSFWLTFWESLHKVLRATQIIASALRFYLKTISNQLSADKERTSPLCMTQYGRIFATTRIPVHGI